MAYALNAHFFESILILFLYPHLLIRYHIPIHSNLHPPRLLLLLTIRTSRARTDPGYRTFHRKLDQTLRYYPIPFINPLPHMILRPIPPPSHSPPILTFIH